MISFSDALFTIHYSLASSRLPAMPEIMIGNGTRHHGLADRHGADADARVMAAFGRDLDLVAGRVDRATRVEDRRGRLHGKARDDRLPGRDTAEDAAGII